jgi:carboxypeptidase PM20D1
MSIRKTTRGRGDEIRMSRLPVVGFTLGTALLLSLAALGYNTWSRPSRQLEVEATTPVPMDASAAAIRLAGALKCATVTGLSDAAASEGEFARLREHLRTSFPRVHGSLEREIVGEGSLLYTWRGTDSTLRPMMVLAHQDVVPIAPGSEGDWKYPPFSGVVQDGYVWGRGAWDDKANLVASLEAVEMLLGEGYRPRRTVYIAAGADEETGGADGAARIAQRLRDRGIRLEYLLDEGLIITEGVFPGLARPLALIGVAEKGYVSVSLRLRDAPGHASMPRPHTPIGSMSKALARLEEQPMPASLSGVVREMLETVGPEMRWVDRIALANLWLFKPLLLARLQKQPSTNAMVRTTTAPTMVHAGNKENVLPSDVEATVNFRLLPGETIAEVLEHVRVTVDNDRIALSTTAIRAEPSKLSRTDVPAYAALDRSIRQVFPDAVVAPGLMIGATDSRHFATVAEQVYRFSPMRARPEDLARFHGTNERISTANFVEMIRFYRQLFLNSTAPPAPHRGGP